MKKKGLEKQIRLPLDELKLAFAASCVEGLVPTFTTVRPTYIFMVICILLMSLCWRAKENSK